MQTMTKNVRRCAGAAILLATLLAGERREASAQAAQDFPPLLTGPTTTPQPRHPSGLDREEPTTAVAERMEGARSRMVNDDRHKRLVSDTERLVQLSAELKVELDKSSKDELSVTVMKKAAEIEKLAHDVRLRMGS